MAEVSRTTCMLSGIKPPLPYSVRLTDLDRLLTFRIRTVSVCKHFKLARPYLGLSILSPFGVHAACGLSARTERRSYFSHVRKRLQAHLKCLRNEYGRQCEVAFRS